MKTAERVVQQNAFRIRDLAPAQNPGMKFGGTARAVQGRPEQTFKNRMGRRTTDADDADPS